MLSAGALDLSFGNGGIAAANIWTHDAITDIALQTDGKIVAVGAATSERISRLFLARFNSDGTLDTTFGNGSGSVTDGDSYGKYSVAIQADGRLLVAFTDGTFNFLLARYNANGTLDTTFGTAGRVLTSIGPGHDYAFGLLIQSDGRIVVTGITSFAAGGTGFAAARFNADGTLDGSFGTDGIVTTQVELSSESTDAALQPDGKIVLCGTSYGLGTRRHFAVVRYTSAGHLDSTFDNDGIAITPLRSTNDAARNRDSDSIARALVVQSDGRIVVVGEAGQSDDSDFAVVRYTTNGSLDTTFGSGGSIVSAVGPFGDYVQDVALQADGRIVVVGYTYLLVNGYGVQVFALVRYNVDGSVDSSFGNNGRVTTGVGYAATCVVIRQDGVILVGGAGDNVISPSSGSDAVLAQYYATDFSSSQVADRFRQPGLTITGATIVTHGYEPFAADGDALFDLARAIRDRADLQNGPSATAWLLDSDVLQEGGVEVYDAAQSILPRAGDPAQSGELVLLWDWAPESNQTSSGWGEAAGDALFSTLLSLGLVDVTKGVLNSIPLHFIGHSFGAAVTSEAVKRLAAFHVPVDQVTYLDPHDFDQGILPIDGAQRLYELGQPQPALEGQSEYGRNYGASVWDNVGFTDVYYQTIVAPDGRPIPGASNRLVNDRVLTGFPHTEVWHGLYRGTVIDPTSTTGYAFSRVADPARLLPRPLPTFFGLDQNHEHSPPLIVDPVSGTFNPAAIDVGLTSTGITNAAWSSNWSPLIVVNGDFTHPGDENDGTPFVGNNTVPGWSDHGGGGGGKVRAEHTIPIIGIPDPLFGPPNYVLTLASGSNERTHNRFYVPSDAGYLTFRFRRAGSGTAGSLMVQFDDDNPLREVSLADMPDSFATASVLIPFAKRNQVHSLKFWLDATDSTALVDSEVWIDDVGMTPDLAPTITDIVNQTTNEDTPLGPLTFTVGDVETASGSLTVTASSSNPALVPNGNLVLGGSGANRTLTITPALNQFGTSTIKVTVSDGLASTSDTFLLTVNAVNDAPTITDIPNQTTNEDTPLGPLTFTVGDVETAPGSLTVTASSSNTTLVPNGSLTLGGSGANRTLTVTPTLNQFGTSTITISVSDGVASASDTFLLTVNAVNDAPAITDTPDQITNEDTPLGPLAFTVGDVEMPAGSLTMTATSSNPALVPNGNLVLGGSGANRTLTITPALNQFGTSTITVSVSDGLTSASDTFLLTVNSVNDVPTITNIPNQTTNEDTPLGPLAFTVGDVETASGSLTVTASSSNPALVPNGNLVLGGSGANRTLTITPALNQFGTSTITVSVSDGVASASDTFLLAVNAVNDAPTITDTPDQTTNEDTLLGPLSFTIGDIESPVGNLTVTAVSSNASLVPNGSLLLGGTGLDRTLTITPALNQSGTTTITVTVSDGQASASDTFLLTVNAVNDAPTITDISNQTTNEDIPLAPLPFTVGDVETAAGSLMVTATSSNTVLIPNGNLVLGGSGANRTLSMTPALNQFGTATITVTVSDGQAIVSDTFLLTVDSVNDVPTITNILNQTTNEDFAVGPLAFTVGDIETAAASLTVSVSSSNAGLVPNCNLVLSGNGANRTLTIIPAASEFGTTTITVTVNDGQADFSTTFLVTVTSVNDAPTGGNDALSSVAEDSGVRLISVATLLGNDGRGPANESGQTLTITSVGSAIGGSVAINGTNVEFTPTANFNGAASFSYTLQDNGTTNGVNDFKTATATVSFAVTEVNDAPSGVDDVLSSMAEDGGVRVISFATLLGNDGKGPGNESGQTLTIAGVGSVVGGTATINGSNIEFTPATDFNGTASFIYTLQDNGTTNGVNDFKTGTASVTFTITEVNDAATGANDLLTGMAEDSGVRLISVATLLENDSKGPANEGSQSLTITAIANAIGGTATMNGTNVEFSPTADFNGTAGFTYTFRDNGTTNGVADFKTGTATVSFTITEINDPPTGINDTPPGVAEDSGVQVISWATLLGNDGKGPANENGQTLSIVGVGNPVGGTVAIKGATVEFTPLVDFNGTASFAYTLQDNGTTNGATDFKTSTATVNFTITPVNDPPRRTAGSVNDLTLLPNSASASLGLAGIDYGPGGGADELGQSLGYTVTSLPPASVGEVLLANGFSPSVGFNYPVEQLRTLTFRRAGTTAGGQGVFSFRVQDNGGTANGGVNSLVESLTITVPQPTGVRMYRAYNPNADYHFFTTSKAEFDNAVRAGYRDETTSQAGFDVLPVPAAGATTIFRLYNIQNGRHYYTFSAGERDFLVSLLPPPASGPDTRKAGWRYEKNEGYIYTGQAAGTTEIFRLYNNNSGVHLYTENAAVKDAVLAITDSSTGKHPWAQHSSFGFAFTVAAQSAAQATAAAVSTPAYSAASAPPVIAMRATSDAGARNRFTVDAGLPAPLTTRGADALPAVAVARDAGKLKLELQQDEASDSLLGRVDERGDDRGLLDVVWSDVARYLDAGLFAEVLQ